MNLTVVRSVTFADRLVIPNHSTSALFAAEPGTKETNVKNVHIVAVMTIFRQNMFALFAKKPVTKALVADNQPIIHII